MQTDLKTVRIITACLSFIAVPETTSGSKAVARSLAKLVLAV